ncbi:MAG TPA: DUF3025 domain-containing protein [Limnobacter sp.]|uniref:DUF3025 domain-containing protein n=1 Tax=Limnobacter sp. TaxID=2003368 RepID=UPI002ED8E345
MAVKPWLQPYGGPTAAWVGDEAGSVAARLNRRAQAMSLEGDVQFESSNQSLGALAYEAQCQQGRIPTRDLAHDWYNGVVWQTFPRFKRALNQAHVQEAIRQDLPLPGNGRNTKRDALTLLDESGGVLLCRDPAVVQALVQHDWSTLFGRQRMAWGTDIQLLVFGHGLLDALDHAHKGLCAKVLPVVMECGELPSIDHLLTEVLRRVSAPAQLSPLPVLGVPGWWAENQDPGFYADPRVFRPKPTLSANKPDQRLALRWDGSTLSS